jgi:hypothetical protein
MTRRRPGYREAITWLARNDDSHWLADVGTLGPMLSVTAAFVCDLFDVTEEKLISDLVRELRRVCPTHPALTGFRK